jgi:CTP:molybdopterin cytidylyltransferase MocA
MIETSHIGALILSAGFSSRMGAFKPLLPFGDKCALQRLIELFHSARIGEIVVVTGHRSREIDNVVDGLEARTIFNARFEEGMMSSVKAGLGALSYTNRAFFVQPVDLPLVRPMSIKALVSAYKEEENDVVYPCFRGKRGHPPLITSRLKEAILNWEGSGGLRAFLGQSGLRSKNLPLIDEFLLLGMNTWDEYEALLERSKNYRSPSTEESLALLGHVIQVDEQERARWEMVADMAYGIGHRLNQAGHELDLELLWASALLHEAIKTNPDHGQRAVSIIEQNGFPEVARLVERRMNTSVNQETALDELHALSLAARISQGDQKVKPE